MSTRISEPADRVLTVAQMRAAEQALIDGGDTVGTLMERAGAGAAEWVWRVAAGRDITVLCGPGNNGGDGYVIARLLRERGGDVKVVAPLDTTTPAARAVRSRYGGEVVPAGEAHGEVLVDCLFGSGLSRPVEGARAEALRLLAARHPFRVAVDLPSGVESDTGALLGDVPRYQLTLALGAWKWAHYLMPAMALMGERRLVPIGVQAQANAAEHVGPPHLQPPAPDAHKYSRGLLAIVGGEMPGAGLLAARGAMRAGAGYVKLLSSHSHPDVPADLVVEEGDLDEALADDRLDALLVGPGLGRSDAARARLESALAAGLPTVLDADALHLLTPAMLEGAEPSRIIATPHEGELARLCEVFGVEAQGKRERALALREKAGFAVLAKGPDTVLATRERTGVFERGPAWLATAGTGDVLAGLLASRLATGADLFTAAGEAVWLQHEAARIAGPGATARAIAQATGAAVARFLSP